MHKAFSNIEGMSIISFQSEGGIGTCKNLIFEPDKMICRVVLVNTNELFKSQKRYIVWDDVLEISNGLYVQDKDVLMEKDELVRHAEVIERDCILIGMKVRTKSGEELGIVYDFILDTTTGSMMKIFVKSGKILAGEHRIIGRNKIVSVEEDTIIVYDNTVEEKVIANDLKKMKKLKIEPTMPIHND